MPASIVNSAETSPLSSKEAWILNVLDVEMFFEKTGCFYTLQF